MINVKTLYVVFGILLAGLGSALLSPSILMLSGVFFCSAAVQMLLPDRSAPRRAANTGRLVSPS